jgi:hypothetical protein
MFARVRWDASGTSRGGLRLRTLVSTQCIVCPILEYSECLAMVSTLDASCCDDFICFTSSSPRACHCLALYRVHGLRDSFFPCHTDEGYCLYIFYLIFFGVFVRTQRLPRYVLAVGIAKKWHTENAHQACHCTSDSQILIGNASCRLLIIRMRFTRHPK